MSRGNKSEAEKAESNTPASESQKTSDQKGEVSSGDQERLPAAGPHAKPELTNDMSTPGAGALPDADDEAAGAQDSTTG